MNIITNIFDIDKRRNSALVLFMIYCFSLLIARAKITNSIYLFFLIWNLFLAGVPYLLIQYLKTYNSIKVKKFFTTIVLFTFVLFLPNSFYIITDFVHLSKSRDYLFWIDLIVISSYSVMGFILGIISLLEFEKIIKSFINKKTVSFIIPIVCFLCGFGIYIGRILRYNSWDIVNNPSLLVLDMITLLASTKALLFSLYFGFFIFIFYLLHKFLFEDNKS